MRRLPSILLLAGVHCAGGADAETDADTAASTDSASDTGAAGDTAVVDSVQGCFESVGLDGTCGPDELSWAVLGPSGCAAVRVPIAEVELQYSIDGDVHHVVFGPGVAEALSVRLPYSVRFSDQLTSGSGTLDAAGWREADTLLSWDDDPDTDVLKLSGTRVSGTFELSGGETDTGAGWGASPDARGAGCFDAVAAQRAVSPP